MNNKEGDNVVNMFGYKAQKSYQKQKKYGFTPSCLTLLKEAETATQIENKKDKDWVDQLIYHTETRIEKMRLKMKEQDRS